MKKKLRGTNEKIQIVERDNGEEIWERKGEKGKGGVGVVLWVN